jgi:eukaryotic-like serine/threonine-protein kinase
MKPGVFAVAISPDNRWLVTGSDDKTARLWDLNAKDPAANPVVLRGHEGRVFAVAISPDSRWLVTGSDDGMARLWDLGKPATF